MHFFAIFVLYAVTQILVMLAEALFICLCMHSMLGVRKGIRPVKNLSCGMLAWLSGMRCRLAYGPADATATHYLLLQKIQIGFNLLGFTFLVPAHLGGPGHIPDEQ